MLLHTSLEWWEDQGLLKNHLLTLALCSFSQKSVFLTHVMHYEIHLEASKDEEGI